jgi:hypothetical protein
MRNAERLQSKKCHAMAARFGMSLACRKIDVWGHLEAFLGNAECHPMPVDDTKKPLMK